MLGAAVADDVMGLVVLTVVVRVVTQGTVSRRRACCGILLVRGRLPGRRRGCRRVGSRRRCSPDRAPFAVGRDARGDRPRLHAGVRRAGRRRQAGRRSSARSSPGSRSAAPVSPTASAASWRRSGTCSSRCSSSQIGIDADVVELRPAHGARATPAILLVGRRRREAASPPSGSSARRSDRLLIGLGMLPRGEVGLIFATIGLTAGVLDDDLYAALLLVVLATTLVTPMLLRWRYQRLAGDRACPSQPAPRSSQPWVGSWTTTVSSRFAPCRPRISCWSSHWRLRSGSPTRRRAASSSTGSPTERATTLVWSKRATDTFFTLLETGDARSWRFLDALDVLPRALPELADALRRRRNDPFLLDPAGLHRWETLERLRELLESTGRRVGVAEAPVPDLGPARRVPRRRARQPSMIGFPSAAGSSSGWSSVRARSTRSPPSSTTPCCSSTSPGVGTRSTSTRSSNSPRTTATPRPPVPRTSSRRALRRSARPASARELHTLVETVLRASNWDVGTQSVVDRNRRDAERASDGSEAVLERSRPHRVATSSWNVRPRGAARGDARSLAIAWSRPIPGQRRCADPPRPPDDGRRGRARSPRPARTRRAACCSDAGLEIDHAIVATWPDGSALESFLVTATEPPPSDVLARRDRGSERGTTGRRARRRRAGRLRRRRVALVHGLSRRGRRPARPAECDRRCARRRRGRRPLRRRPRRPRHRDRSLRGDRGAGQALHHRTGGDRRQPPVRLRAARCPRSRFGGFWDRLRATWTSDAGQHPDTDSSSS